MPRSTESPPPLRFGVLGAGWMGRLHAECVERLPEASVVAIADPLPAARAAFVDRFPAVTAHASLEDMLESGGCDVVALCTPSGQHADQAIAASEAGKHVVVEKPITTDPHDAARMVAAAAAGGVTLSVIHQYRFTRDALRLKRAVEHGRFGRILLANAFVVVHRQEAYFSENGAWRSTWQANGGGVLINQAIHAVDLLQWMFGTPAEVKAIGGTLVHELIEVEDTISAAIAFHDGTQGVIQATQAAAADRPLRIEVIGDRGRAVFERSRLTAWDVPDESGLLSPAEELALPLVAEGQEAFGRAHERQFAALVADLRAGRQPQVSGADAASSLELVTSIYESAGLRTYAAR